MLSTDGNFFTFSSDIFSFIVTLESGECNEVSGRQSNDVIEHLISCKRPYYDVEESVIL